MPTEKLLSSTAVKEHRPPLDTADAAVYAGTTKNYLEKLRCTGDGPVFLKNAGAVSYDPDDLDSWLKSLKRTSTSGTRKCIPRKRKVSEAAGVAA